MARRDRGDIGPGSTREFGWSIASIRRDGKRAPVSGLRRLAQLDRGRASWPSDRPWPKGESVRTRLGESASESDPTAGKGQSMSGPLDAAWRMASHLGFPLARVWWRLRRARHEGALVAVTVDRALLLVRSS